MKKISILHIFLIFFAFFGFKASAQPIVSGISTNEINIDTKFNGQKILLFGAKGDAGDIVIAVRGPKRSFLVTKKEKLFGIWYNGSRVHFQDSLSYYSTFSTFENNETTQKLLSQLEIGANNIKFKIFDKEDEDSDNINKKEFTLELIKDLQKSDLYQIGANKIDFLDETLFKVSLNFPKNISVGIYTVEIYLINEGQLISFQSIPIYVKQIGLSANISNYSKKQPLFYGIFAVLLALIIGWFANFIFSKIFSR